VPEHRRNAAQRVLALAKLTAIVRAAPDIAEIEARYRGDIMEAALSTAAPHEGEAAFVAELLAKVTPERIAAAFLRQQLMARPVPEDIVPLPIAEMQAKKTRRDKRVEHEQGEFPVREPRGPDME